MNTIKKFLLQLLSKEGTISSKILFGIIMLVQAIVLSYVKEASVDVTNMIQAFLWAGEILLGVSIASDVATKIATKSSTKE